MILDNRLSVSQTFNASLEKAQPQLPVSPTVSESPPPYRFGTIRSTTSTHPRSRAQSRERRTHNTHGNHHSSISSEFLSPPPNAQVPKTHHQSSGALEAPAHLQLPSADHLSPNYNTISSFSNSSVSLHHDGQQALPYNYNTSSRLNLSESPPPLPLSRPSSSSTVPTSQVFMQTGSKSISGTWFIDPLLPAVSNIPIPRSSHHRHLPPNACFRSRSGPININLVATGHPSQPSKAVVDVVTRSSDISVNLLELQPSKCVHLQAYSRTGDITLFVPKNFDGVVHLRTRKGTIDIMPALAKMIRILKSTDDEALIMITGGSYTPPARPGLGTTGFIDAPAADFCELNSRSGKLSIGLSGEDRTVPKVGLWGKLFHQSP